MSQQSTTKPTSTKVRRTLDLLTTDEYLAVLALITARRQHLASTINSGYEYDLLDRAALKIAQIVQSD